MTVDEIEEQPPAGLASCPFCERVVTDLDTEPCSPARSCIYSTIVCCDCGAHIVCPACEVTDPWEGDDETNEAWERMTAEEVAQWID